MSHEERSILLAVIDGLIRTRQEGQLGEVECYIDNDGIQTLKSVIQRL